MASTTSVLILLSLLHVITSSTASATTKPPQAILNAAETLSNSGYNAMSLTLQSILTDSSLFHLATSVSTSAATTSAATNTGGRGSDSVRTPTTSGGVKSGSDTTTRGGDTTSTTTGGGDTTSTTTGGGRDKSTTIGGGRDKTTPSSEGLRSGATSTTTTTTTTGGASHLTLTIFTPPDSAFIASGQPSLSQLLLHFVPLSLSISSLSSLPYGTKIHTLSPSAYPLVITSAPGNGNSRVEINEVELLGSPIYDDGSVVVFAVEDFFKPNFTIEGTTENARRSSVDCSDLSPFSTLTEAVGKLKSRGYSIMASFLELQMMGYLKVSPWPLKLTMFAPEDEVLLRFSGDIPSYSGLFLRHMLCCKLSFADLNWVENGTVYKDNFEGLRIVIEKTDKAFFVNGIEITSPDLYDSDWIAIHGIRGEIIQQPDEGIEDEELEDEEEEEDDDDHSVSYNEKASSPNANENEL